MRALAAAVEAAADGRGSVVILAGDPGVGKSRLAGEATRLAGEQGFEVIVGHAVESAHPVPLRPIAEALFSVARDRSAPDAEELAEYWPALGLIVPEWSRGGADAERSPLVLGEAVLRLLSALNQTGTMLVLEEIQWADPETLAMLEYLAANIGDRHVVCVATVRRGEPSPALDAVQAMHARRAAEVMEVTRLGEEDVARMAAICLDQDPLSPEITRRLLSHCDGLPFAVEEILAAAVASGELTVTPEGWQIDRDITTGLPPSIVGAVRRRMASLAQPTAEILTWAAVLGREFDWRLLPGLVRAGEQEVLSALRHGCDVGLIEPQSSSQAMFRFRHSLTRQAIVSDLLPPDLGSRAAAAAAAVERAHPQMTGEWCDLAARLHLAAGEPVRAAELLLRAGRKALQDGALRSSVRSLEQAREALEQVAEPAAQLCAYIDNALVRALELTGDPERMRPVAARLVATLDRIGADERWKANVRMRMARALAVSHPEDAAGHLGVARDIANRLADPALHGRLDAVAASCAVQSGEVGRALELANRALAQAEAAGPQAWTAEASYEALKVIGTCESGSDIRAARAAFERAYTIATAEKMPIRRIDTLQELGTIEMMDDVGTGNFREARKLAVDAGAISTVATIDLQLAVAWSLTTELDRGLVSARQCEQSARRLGLRRLQAMAICMQAAIHGIRGDRKEAERQAARGEQGAAGDLDVLFLAWGLARVDAALFVDDIVRAHEASLTAISYAQQRSMSARRPWGYWALLETISGGDGRAALDRARSAGAGDYRWNRGVLCYAEAVLEGRSGRTDRAGELAEDGAEQLSACAPWWNHLMRRLVAPMALADGWGQPVAWLRDAIGDFEASGHARLASACRGLLRRVGERVPRQGRGEAAVPGELRRLGVTSREMDVLLLVGQGLSNAEIASRLYISPKTVETHIASLAAKTGQSGRRELVAHAASLAQS